MIPILSQRYKVCTVVCMQHVRDLMDLDLVTLDLLILDLVTLDLLNLDPLAEASPRDTKFMGSQNSRISLFINIYLCWPTIFYSISHSV